MGNLKSQIKSKLQNNENLYVLSRVFKERSKEQFHKLILGFYEYSPAYTSVILEHPGELHPQDIVYYIPNGEIPKERSGFFAVMRATLIYLYYADAQGFTPVVRWGKFCLYYDKELADKTTNVFEYYYEPTSHVSYEEALQSKNLIRAAGWHWNALEYDLGFPIGSYKVPDRELQSLAGVYKKYCRLNKTTKEYMEKSLPAVINGKRTLGVHARGTDFRYGVAVHPVFVTPEEFLQETKKLLSTGKYEQVFLATDDAETLALFKSNIPEDQLVYFSDTLRGTGMVNPFDMESSRPLHRYKLGLEVLRDVYALACCDGLVGGLSQVGFAARYIKLAMGQAYEDCSIIDKGTRTRNSKAADERKKRLIREEKELIEAELNEHGKNP